MNRDYSDEAWRDIERDEDLLIDIAKDDALLAGLERRALYVGSVTAADLARVTARPKGGPWTEEDETRDTLIPPPDADAPTFPKTCRCCGWPVTAAEWVELKTRREWTGFGLEVAECPGCPEDAKNTLSIPVGPRRPEGSDDPVEEHRQAEGDDAMAEERAETERAWREGSF